MGVSGYGTDQEYLLLKRIYDEYKPTLVLLVFCADNDHEDNSSNVQPGGYYKPYFETEKNGLSLRGVPVPKSESFFLANHAVLRKSYLVRALVRAFYKLHPAPEVHPNDPTPMLLMAMRDFVRAKGALFAVGVEGPHRPLEKLLQDCCIPVIDLSLEQTAEYRYSTFGDHWTPTGHSVVCDRLDPFLTALIANARTNSTCSTNLDMALFSYHYSFAETLSRTGEPKWAVAEYYRALRINPSSVEALNNLAWMLATAPDEKARNGAEAVRLSEKACDLTGHTNTLMLGTAAAAYAENGQFEQAVQLGNKACRSAEAHGETNLLNVNQSLVRGYREHRAFRARN